MTLKLGDTGDLVARWRHIMAATFAGYARALGPLAPGSVFGQRAQAWQQEYERRTGQPVDGIVSDQDLADLKIIALPAPGPPANRHLAVVFRGTGGIIGQDYVSLVCQPNADLIEEINPPWAATMGGLPVGTAGGIGDPSMNKGAADALHATIPIIDGAVRANPNRKIVVGGYSAGAVVAAMVRQYVQTKYPNNYLCSFSLGDPSRPPGGCYYPFDGAAQPGGQGIGSWHYGDVTDPRHCWLANHTDPSGPDMYTVTPLGVTGQIMQDSYDMVTNFAFTDIVAATEAIVKAIPEIASAAGISVPAVLGALSGGIPGLAGFGIPLLIAALEGLIGLGNPDTLTGTAAAAAAARIALTFLAAGTGPHIRYHLDEVWPGQTYLGLAIQHVRFHSLLSPPVGPTGA